jgi:hypothetical protein
MPRREVTPLSVAGCGIQIDTRNRRLGALADRPAPSVCAVRAAATWPLPPIRRDPGAESTTVIAITAADHGEQCFSGCIGGPPGSGVRSACCRLHRRQWRPGATIRAPGSSTQRTKKNTPGQPLGRRARSPLPYRKTSLISVTTGVSLTASRHDSPHSTGRHSPLPPPARPLGKYRLQHGISGRPAKDTIQLR